MECGAGHDPKGTVPKKAIEARFDLDKIPVQAVAENQPANKNRMTSELSIFAARARDYIGICADEFVSEHTSDPAFQAHADVEFNGLALMLFTLQYKHNAAYRKICEARKVSPNTVSHWKEIPAAPASAFKELELSSLPAKERTTVFHSSGTTAQQPSRHFHNRESLTLYEASLLLWFRANVLADLKSEISNLKFLSLTPPPADAPHSSLVHMFQTVWSSGFTRSRDGAPPEARTPNCFLGILAEDGSWTLDFDAVMTALQTAAKSKHPVLLVGTAFSFVHLLDFLVVKHLRFVLPSGSRVMETGGYKNLSHFLPKADLHALITERLGVLPEQIICEYGMSELSSQAYDSASRITHHASRVLRFPPWARALIVSPETGREVAEGETGLLRIFDLANVFSVMAIQTEDLAIRRTDGFELIGRAAQSEPRGCSLMSTGS